MSIERDPYDSPYGRQQRVDRELNEDPNSARNYLSRIKEVPNMTKTQTVLDFDCISGFTAFFYTPEDGESEISRSYELNMLESTWKELGSPKRITVTIESGDLLNV